MRLVSKTLTLACIELFSLKINAQSLIWANHYTGNSLSDGSDDIHLGGDGYIYMCGSKGTNSGDALVQSFTTAGTVRWSQSYTSTYGADEGTAITTYGSGTSTVVYVAGYISVFGNGQDMLLLKYDQAGNIQWSGPKTWNNSGGSQEIANCIAVDLSGNVFVAGRTSVNGGDLFVRKYDATGSLIWSMQYNSSGTQDDAPQYMKINSAGTYLYITSIRTISSTDHNAVLQKIDASNSGNGAIAWTSVYDNTLTSDIDETYWLDIDANEYIYTAGTTTSSSNGQDGLILKYNNGGTLLGSATRNGANNLDDKFASIAVTGPSTATEIYATGYTTVNVSSNDADYFTVKYNLGLTWQWTSTYDGTGTGCPVANDDYANMILISPNTGKVYVTGNSYESLSSGAFNETTVRYNPSTGTQEWINSYDRNLVANQVAGKYPLELAYDGCHSWDYVLVAGMTGEGNSNQPTDATVIEYGYTGLCDGPDPGGRIRDSENQTSGLTGIFPNPLFGKGIFKCDAISSDGVLVVFDMSGKKVASIKGEANIEISVDLSGFPSGLYFYQYILEDRIISQGKFILSADE